MPEGGAWRGGERRPQGREVLRRSQKSAGATAGHRGDGLGSRGVKDRRPRAEADRTPGDPRPVPAAPVSAVRRAFLARPQTSSSHYAQFCLASPISMISIKTFSSPRNLKVERYYLKPQGSRTVFIIHLKNAHSWGCLAGSIGGGPRAGSRIS